MDENSLVVDDDNLGKSKYTQRDELRSKIHQSVGDAEALFSVDSDLLQIMTYAMVSLYDAIETNETYSGMLDAVDPDIIHSLSLLSQGLKDKSLIFPIDTKRQYKSEDEIIDKLKDRYTETSVYLGDYYRSRNLTNNNKDSS
ncbi:hypothetical protein L3V83_13970 [Thiotrichales bacterium 19X7-9]|nr:hypothetical protein [Thiotrichales bacterium 19X7-9]